MIDGKQHLRRHAKAMIAVIAALLLLGVPSALADTAPTVTIAAPTGVDFNSAHVAGTVNPNGGPSTTEWRLQYASEAGAEIWLTFASGEFSEENGQNTETVPLAVEAELQGLASGSEYFVRLIAENEAGANRIVSEEKAFTTDAVEPPEARELAVSAVTASSAHFVATVNSGGTAPGEATNWHFECSPECALSGEASGEVSDGADHVVEADATGLEPHVPYTVRLVAVDAAELRAEDEAGFETAAVAPEAETFAITGPVSSTAAHLVGHVNPHNSDTTYRFEYGTSTAYGSLTPSTGPVSGPALLFVGQDISGLAPSTTYHYRLIADNGVGGPVVGEDRTFTTAPVPVPRACPNEAIRAAQDSTYLADCRAYEMVSPSDKNGLTANQTSPLSADGNHVLFGMFGGAPQSTSGSVSWLRATRTSSGWVSENVLPPFAEQVESTYQLAAANPELDGMIWSVAAGFGQQGFAPKLNWVRTEGSLQSPLVVFPTFFGNSGAELVATEDLSHVFARVPVALDPSHQPETANVYDFGSGTPRLVSVMPGTDSAPACGVDLNIGFVTTFVQAAISQHWISRDGSRAFFLSRGDDCGEPLQLYVRDLDSAETTLISGPPTSGADQGADFFLQAAPDGSWVIYRTASALDAVDTDTTADIYRWRQGAGNECLTCVASGPADVSLEIGGEQSIGAAVSEDGSHVYFISQSQIDGQGTAGQNNLYVLSDGAIAYIGPSDGVSAAPTQKGEVSFDGNTLLFLSAQAGLNQITGSDNGSHLQMYRYDDRLRQLACVSCPEGRPAQAEILGLISPGQTTLDRRSAMSADGRLVAFATTDSLVPADVNGQRDVYQWHDGRLSLISSGQATYGNKLLVELVTVSADGRDILFEDFPDLTLDDQDETRKLFDARVDGGFPTPPAPPAACTAEACQSPPAGQTASLGGGSDAFGGPGNVKQKRHHKRTHGKKHHGKKHHKRANQNRRAGR